jgi:hypothetical protein
VKYLAQVLLQLEIRPSGLEPLEKRSRLSWIWIWSSSTAICTSLSLWRRADLFPEVMTD